MKKKLFAMAFIAAMVGQVNAATLEDAMQAASGAFDTAMKAEMNNHRQDQILDKHDSDIASNKQGIAANKDAIASNKEQLDAVRDIVNAEQHQRVENTANIAQNTATNIKQDHAIAANKDAIASNTETIRAHYAEMKNNFAAVNTRLDNLDDEMKKGFAANAAIAGLFQPYSVGKFNVTAALGGYDSEQAIAIGSGYRFNENFAMKAGVATNTSDFDAVTYNVGVNFEW